MGSGEPDGGAARRQGAARPMGGQRTDKEQRARWWAAHPMGSGEPGRGQSTRWGGRVPDGGAECPMGSSTPGQNCTRWEAECDKGLRARTEVHPMGSRAPDGEQYTWTERVQCTPIGCRALANKHKRGALPLAGTRGAVAAGWTVCGACGAMRAWGIGADRGACGDDGCPAAPTPAPGGSRCVWGTMAAPPRPPPRRVDRGACGGDAGVGHRRGSWRSLCVSRRPRPCRCRDGCRETRAPGEPGRWPLRR